MSYKKLELNDKCAVVIGGTSGIGRAIAHGLAEAGADVVCTSRRAEQVEAAAKEIEELGRKTARITSDVSDLSSLEALRDECIATFGKVDILVNCAGRTKRGPTVDEGDSCRDRNNTPHQMRYAMTPPRESGSDTCSESSARM